MIKDKIIFLISNIFISINKFWPFKISNYIYINIYCPFYYLNLTIKFIFILKLKLVKT